MSDDLTDFEQFMRMRELAADAYVNGDPAPVCELAAQADPASFFHPRGDVLQGAGPVAGRYASDAQNFEPGSEGKLEILHMAASDGLAYWVGFQHAKVKMKGKPEPVSMGLRITEIFRREGDAWKLIHRHADMLPAETAK